MRATILLAVLTLTTTLAVANPNDHPTCPTMQDEQYYNSTTQEVTAISYVKPLTTPTKLIQVGYLANENAKLTAKLQPSDAESVMYFGERLPLHVSGISTGNPIFGDWRGFTLGLNNTHCTWDAVDKYLREGGSGLRLRRENLSTLTVAGWTPGNKTRAGTYEKYVAEPSNNTNAILVVFSDSVELEISLAQANVVQLSGLSFGPLPETPGYRAVMCSVTRSGTESMESFDVGPSLVRQSTETQFRLLPSHSPNSCSGLQILYTTEPGKTTTPAPTPSESSAVQSTARLAIASSLFVAAVPSILLL